MGEMADLALQSVLDMESLRDDYTNGHISNEDAYELGFIDPLCVEQEGVEAAWDRNNTWTEDEMDSDIKELLRVLNG